MEYPMFGKTPGNPVAKIIKAMTNPNMTSSREERVRRFGFSGETEKKILSNTRCFITATGPSLAKVDPAGTANEFIIGVNHILRSEINPDIICTVDPARLDRDYITSFKGKIIVPQHVFKRHEDVLSKVDCYSDIEYVDHETLKKNVNHIDALDENLNKIYWSASVVSDLCIPLAVYLGFKEVYVLGLDGIRSSFPSSHIWGQDKNILTPADSMVHYLHQVVGSLAKKAGCDVRNASLGGQIYAFPKVSLTNIAPSLVRTNLSTSPENKFILFKGNILKVVPGAAGNTTWRLHDAVKSRWLTRKGRRIILESEDIVGNAPESHFHIEPSFIRQDWCSLRSFDLKGHYITAENSFSSYDLRPTSGFFSPYFSSFQLYRNEEETRARAEIDKRLASLDKQKKELGNLLIENDMKS